MGLARYVRERERDREEEEEETGEKAGRERRQKIGSEGREGNEER